MGTVLLVFITKLKEWSETELILMIFVNLITIHSRFNYISVSHYDYFTRHCTKPSISYLCFITCKFHIFINSFSPSFTSVNSSIIYKDIILFFYHWELPISNYFLMKWGIVFWRQESIFFFLYHSENRLYFDVFVLDQRPLLDFFYSASSMI
jgi:hypothetical protein